MPANKTMRIEMVADVVCPYCHIGLKRLLGAIAAASGASAAAVEVVYTPFILRRHLPKEGVDKRTAFKQQYGNDAHGEHILGAACRNHQQLRLGALVPRAVVG